MMRPILLDTCALLWLGNNQPLAAEAEAALQDIEAQPGGIAVSPISAWEIGQLYARERIALPIDPLSWFQTTLDMGVTLAPMAPAFLVASSFHPCSELRDPADRIVAATARALGYRLMTRDGPLLKLAEKGHLNAIAC